MSLLKLNSSNAADVTALTDYIQELTAKIQTLESRIASLKEELSLETRDKTEVTEDLKLERDLREAAVKKLVLKETEARHTARVLARLQQQTKMDKIAIEGIRQKANILEYENVGLKEELKNFIEQATTFRKKSSELEDLLVKERTKRLQDIHTNERLTTDNARLAELERATELDAIEAREHLLQKMQNLETANALSAFQKSIIDAQITELNAFQVEHAMNREETRRMKSELLSTQKQVHSKEQEVTVLTGELLHLRDEVTNMAVTHSDRSKTLSRSSSRAGTRIALQSLHEDLGHLFESEHVYGGLASSCIPNENSTFSLRACTAPYVSRPTIASSTGKHSLKTNKWARRQGSPGSPIMASKGRESEVTRSSMEHSTAEATVRFAKTELRSNLCCDAKLRSRNKISERLAKTAPTLTSTSCNTEISEGYDIVDHLTRPGSEYVGHGLGLRKSDTAQYVPNGGSAKECLRRILSSKDASTTKQKIQALLID